MLMHKIAFRNIFRQRRRSILTALSMFGGFVMAAFFIGFSDGTYNRIIDTFTRNQKGHIQLHHHDYLDRPSLYKTINHLPAIEKKVLSQMEDIDSWTSRIYSAGLVSVGEKSAGVRIIGIQPEKEIQTTRFNEKIIDGKIFSAEDALEVIIGKGLAKLLKGRVGDDIVVVSQAADGSIANDKYTVVGIVDFGDEISDRISFYLPLKTAQELLVLEGRVHEVVITVNSLYDVESVTQAIDNKLRENHWDGNSKADNGIQSPLAVAPWQEFARSFYIAMKADKEGMWIMLLIIVLVVAVGVLNTVLMSVLERRREYGVLKAVGTKPFQIVKMVLLEVNILSLICIVLGIGVGLLINYIFSIYGIAIPEPMTYGGIKFQYMFTEINLRSFIIPAVIVLISATLVSLFPALKAAHTDPARSMRTH